MYRFSRSIYRELSPKLGDGCHEQSAAARNRVLESCEAMVRRLACDRRYFARPTQSLFTEIRDYFPLAEQVYVYRVIERNVQLAQEFLERLPADVNLDGQPRECHASTRKGTPCQREPLPGRDYCPSHKHLEEVFEVREADASPVAA
jgi:hypothetical protein